MPKKKQATLFDKKEHDWWREHWRDMPSFEHEDIGPHSSIIVHFLTEEDRKAFGEFIKQTVTYKTKSLWFPKAETEAFVNYRWVDSDFEIKKIEVKDEQIVDPEKDMFPNNLPEKPFVFTEHKDEKKETNKTNQKDLFQ